MKMSTSRISVSDMTIVTTPPLSNKNKMKVIKYTEDWRQKWDHFVKNESINGNLFHEQKFLSYHGDKFEDCSVLVSDGDKDEILAIMPAALKRDGSKKGVVSHPGSTYGGVIYKMGLRTRTLKEALDLLIKHYRNEYGADYIKMILPEEFHTGASSDGLTFLLWHRGFQIQTKEISCVKDLKDSSFDRFRATTKQYIRSKKDERLGIQHGVAREESEIVACYRLIENNLQDRHSKRLTHSLDELLHLKKIYEDNVTLFYSEYDSNIVASVVVFELTKKVVHDFYIAQNYEFATLNPLVGLFSYIFNFYRDKGYEFFNFGISSRDKWIKWGILEFKEQFGTDILTRDSWILADLAGEWPDDGAPNE